MDTISEMGGDLKKSESGDISLTREQFQRMRGCLRHAYSNSFSVIFDGETYVGMMTQDGNYRIAKV